LVGVEKRRSGFDALRPDAGAICVGGRRDAFGRGVPARRRGSGGCGALGCVVGVGFGVWGAFWWGAGLGGWVVAWRRRWRGGVRGGCPGRWCGSRRYGHCCGPCAFVRGAWVLSQSGCGATLLAWGGPRRPPCSFGHRRVGGGRGGLAVVGGGPRGGLDWVVRAGGGVWGCGVDGGTLRGRGATARCGLVVLAPGGSWVGLSVDWGPDALRGRCRMPLWSCTIRWVGSAVVRLCWERPGLGGGGRPACVGRCACSGRVPLGPAAYGLARGALRSLRGLVRIGAARRSCGPLSGRAVRSFGGLRSRPVVRGQSPGWGFGRRSLRYANGVLPLCSPQLSPHQPGRDLG